jgi:hypothetical protein
MWSAAAAICLVGGVGAAVDTSAHESAGSHRVPTATAADGGPSGSASTAESVSAAVASASSAVATGPSSTPAPADTTRGAVVNAAGAVLPDPVRTPGATNPAVTQADIDTTICVSGWTATVRPPSSYTTALKQRQLASGYAYHGDTATADYEEDHLISLEIGGSPDSELNLWPQPYDVPDGARVKDVVENKLHGLVCAHTITLATAQRAIAVNWWDAYVRYVGSPAPMTTAHAAPPPTSHSASW